MKLSAIEVIFKTIMIPTHLFVIISVALAIKCGALVQNHRNDKVQFLSLLDHVDDVDVDENKSKTAASDCPCSDSNLCKTISTPARKEIFAFSVGGPDWIKYDWSRVTTIAMFGGNNSDLMCFAHSKGVRVVLKGIFGSSTLYDKDARNQWIKDKLKSAIAQHLDGINIDIEFPVNKTSAPILTQFVKDITKAFHLAIPNSQVTFDVAWSPKCIDKCCECVDLRCYDYKAIADETDFVFVMSYDEQSQICGDCIGIANSPYDQTAKGIQGFLDLGINPNKLVLGLPWYGYDYPCLQFKDNICSLEKVPFRGVPCSDAAGSQKEYQIIQSMMRNNATTGRQWNDQYKAPFFNFKNATGYPHQMWYDDPESLTYRLKYAKEKDLRGAGMWHSDCLDYNNATMVKEMWESFDAFLK